MICRLRTDKQTDMSALDILDVTADVRMVTDCPAYCETGILFQLMGFSLRHIIFL
jgi:hypothetical protein